MSKLKERYGLIVTSLARVPIGQGTVNYRARTEAADYFVKCYPRTADLSEEELAVELGRTATKHRVPVPRVLANRDGALVDRPSRISVWEWVTGRVVTEGLTTSHYQQLGETLGRIHLAFLHLPASTRPAPRVDAWFRKMDASYLASRVERLQSLVTHRLKTHEADPFDRVAETTLSERLADLSALPSLLATLPTLSAQVIHGDYTMVNVLFASDRLAAVVDFRPPHPFMPAWELARVAFSPDAVVTDPNWLSGSAELVGAYVRANPEARAGDVLACGTLALLQLLRSIYGVREHYVRPGIFQSDLDQFWVRRHQTARTLLTCLPEIDDMLIPLATSLAQ